MRQVVDFNKSWMIGIMGVKYTKEELLAQNVKLNRIKKRIDRRI